jgi:hypothetical protein
MDGEVRVKDTQTPLESVYSSHTLHRNRPAGKGQEAVAEPRPTRRECLITAAVDAVADGSVDRLAKSRDATKALEIACFLAGLPTSPHV